MTGRAGPGVAIAMKPFIQRCGMAGRAGQGVAIAMKPCIQRCGMVGRAGPEVAIAMKPFIQQCGMAGRAGPGVAKAIKPLEYSDPPLHHRVAPGTPVQPPGCKCVLVRRNYSSTNKSSFKYPITAPSSFPLQQRLTSLKIRWFLSPIQVQYWMHCCPPNAFAFGTIFRCFHQSNFWASKQQSRRSWELLSSIGRSRSVRCVGRITSKAPTFGFGTTRSPNAPLPKDAVPYQENNLRLG
jgi:hypothetical protein